MLIKSSFLGPTLINRIRKSRAGPTHLHFSEGSQVISRHRKVHELSHGVSCSSCILQGAHHMAALRKHLLLGPLLPRRGRQNAFSLRKDLPVLSPANVPLWGSYPRMASC